MQVVERWRKSSYSGHESSCLEVGRAPGVVGVRDTKDRAGGILRFDRDQWATFITSLCAGNLP